MIDPKLNLVVGVATNLMTALGMPWRVEVGNLCNFADDFETINLRWKMAEKHANKLMESMQQRNAELLAALESLLEMPSCINTDKKIGEHNERRKKAREVIAKVKQTI